MCGGPEPVAVEVMPALSHNLDPVVSVAVGRQLVQGALTTEREVEGVRLAVDPVEPLRNQTGLDDLPARSRPAASIVRADVVPPREAHSPAPALVFRASSPRPC
jgi:hypothetical protein